MRSGFFNSEIIGYDAENMPVFDRAEEASFFAKYFSQFISNGVFPNPSTNMQVLADSGMNVKVDIGVCYINGYMGWVEPAETLEIEESDTQSRIDRIVARLDFDDRSISLAVKKGTAQGNPVAPEVQRDYDIYEIALADIRVNANAIEITQENITDLRLNTELCGIVANQLQHVDTTTIFNQYQSWYTRVTGEAEEKLENAEQLFEEQFNTWFVTIQDILDEDTAGHLYNLINTKSNKKKNWNITLDKDNWEQTPVYELTSDESIDNEKTYYTRTGSGTTLNPYVYTEVEEPDVSDIATYYEITSTTMPYTQTIEVSGILSTDVVNAYPIYSEVLETRASQKENYNKLSILKSTVDSITLECDEEAPEIDLDIRLEVVY